MAEPLDGLHWTQDILRFRDTDANGHVNNSVFSVLCESGRVDLVRSRLTPFLDPGRYFVVARLAIDFRLELHYPGTIRTATWIEGVGRSSIRFGQRVLNGDALAAQAESVCVLMAAETRRPAPLTGRVREAAEALVRPAP